MVLFLKLQILLATVKVNDQFSRLDSIQALKDIVQSSFSKYAQNATIQEKTLKSIMKGLKMSLSLSVQLVRVI